MGIWQAERVIDIPEKKVQGWALPVMPGEMSLQLLSKMQFAIGLKSPGLN